MPTEKFNIGDRIESYHVDGLYADVYPNGLVGERKIFTRCIRVYDSGSSKMGYNLTDAINAIRTWWELKNYKIDILIGSLTLDKSKEELHKKLNLDFEDFYKKRYEKSAELLRKDGLSESEITEKLKHCTNTLSDDIRNDTLENKMNLLSELRRTYDSVGFQKLEN